MPRVLEAWVTGIKMTGIFYRFLPYLFFFSESIRYLAYLTRIRETQILICSFVVRKNFFADEIIFVYHSIVS